MMSKLPMIDLSRGWPSATLLPASQMLKASQCVLSNPILYASALQYAPDPGCDALRQALAVWLAELYAIPWAVPSRICITGGASQSLSNILQVYSNPTLTRNIFMVTPTYHLACRIFEDNGFAGKLKAVPEDSEGINIDYLEKCLSTAQAANGYDGDKIPNKRLEPSQKFYQYIIYCVPAFSNPSGKTMTIQRKRQLVRLARKYDALVIADDVYDQLQWPLNSAHDQTQKSALVRLVDIDHELDGGAASDGFGHAISNGSFSKILAPGCRTGWVEASEKFTYGLSRCGSSISGGAPSQLAASIIVELLAKGELTTHINSFLIPALARRYQLALNAVRQYLEPLGARVNDCRGGYFLWIELPFPLECDEFAARARDSAHVVVAAETLFLVQGDEASVKCRRKFRICFAWEDEGLLAEGIERLGRVMQHML